MAIGTINYRRLFPKEAGEFSRRNIKIDYQNVPGNSVAYLNNPS